MGLVIDILRVQNLDRFSTWLTKSGVRISLVLFYYIECIGFFWTACYTRAKKGHENDRFMVIKLFRSNYARDLLTMWGDLDKN